MTATVSAFLKICNINYRINVLHFPKKANNIINSHNDLNVLGVVYKYY